MFLPCDASSLLLNPVKQESTGGRHEGPQEGVWAETRRLLAPWAPPRLERRPLGTGTGTGQRREAPVDGNYDFRKLECCLGNINAHLSMGGTLGAGGWGVCTAHTCSHTNIYTYVCTHICRHTQVHSHACTPTHAHTCTQIYMHTHVYRHTCACTQVCTCVHKHVCVHAYIHPCQASDSPTLTSLPESLQAPRQTQAEEGGGKEGKRERSSCLGVLLGAPEPQEGSGCSQPGPAVWT